jgi:hypothetical protein
MSVSLFDSGHQLKPLVAAGSVTVTDLTSPARIQISSGLQFFTSSGAAPALKVWVGSATTDSSGLFSCNISSASFSTVVCVQATSVFSAGSAITENQATVHSVSTTAIAGAVLRGLAVLLGGNTIQYDATAGRVVHVTVFGT